MLKYEDLYLSACFIIVVMSGIMGMMLFLNLRHGLPRKTTMNRFSGLLYLVMFFFGLTILIERFLFGKPGEVNRVLFYIVCFNDYVLCGLFPYAGSGVLLYAADPKKESKGVRRFLHGLMLLHIVLLLVSQFTGLYYSIDAGNIYHRGRGFLLSMVTPGLMLGTDVWILLRFHKNMQQNERNAFWVIAAIMAAGMGFHAVFLNVVPLAAMLCTLLLHVFFSEKQVEESFRRQQENQRLRTEIMHSQIQPHFLYNSLGAIAELCDTDPQKAKSATLQFSRYFQGFMESINTQETIPFEQELAQSQRYLELEQLRYEDALRVEYQIDCLDFLIPPMCLQPLVENAIRHGIRRNPGGRGTVTLTAAERSDCYEVTVRDDGPGLSPRREQDRERIHIGLSNVRERLRLLCGGSLELRMEPGKGAAAIIRIPKHLEGQDADFCH